MVLLGLSATKFFKHWPDMAKEYESFSMHDAYMETLKHSGEQMIQSLKVTHRLQARGLQPGTSPGSFQMRPLLYGLLLQQLVKLGIDIHSDQRVIDFEETADKGRVITDQGITYEADIIIAADGVGTKSQKIVGGQVRAVPSGRAMWRAVIPREHLNSNPQVRDSFDSAHTDDGDKSKVRFFLG